MESPKLKTIHLEAEGPVVTIKLDRPDRLNALNVMMIDELTGTFRRANDDSSVRVIILTGSGDRAFCSGADLTQEQLGKSGQYEQHLEELYHPLLRTITESSKPYIAVLNGAVVGAGIGLALACDYIIAVPDVQFYMAFARIGLVPDTGVMSFVTHRIGRHKAFDWAATAGVMTANEAFSNGMVNEISEPDQLSDVVKKKAEAYVRMPKVALGLIKQMSHASLHHSLDEILVLERNLQERAAAEPDHMEGVRAFLEKRSPEFSK